MNIENFRGVFMRDGLPSKCTDNESLISNLQGGDSSGSHWTSLFIHKNKGYYFDSYGHGPTVEIQNYMRHINNRFFSTFKIQGVDEVICGHYCLFVLLNLQKGYDFYEILKSLLKYSRL